MKKNKLEQDYSRAQHTAWERYAHRLEKLAGDNEAVFTTQERSNAIEAFIRQHPQKAGDIVICEVCQDKIELERNSGRPAFEDNPSVRQMLRTRGIVAGNRAAVRSVVPL